MHLVRHFALKTRPYFRTRLGYGIRWDSSLKSWNYAVSPPCILRYDGKSLEVKNLQTDKWEDVSIESDWWQLLQEDSFPASEEQALEIHERKKIANRPSSSAQPPLTTGDA